MMFRSALVGRVCVAFVQTSSVWSILKSGVQFITAKGDIGIKMFSFWYVKFILVKLL